MADKLEVLAVANRLRSCGAFRGAAQVLFNAAAQGQATQAGDLQKRPAFGRRVEAEKHPAPANDHIAPSAKPSPVGGGL